MRRFLVVFSIMLLLPLYIFFQRGIWTNRAQVRSEAPAGFLIPSGFSRILALGYKGVLSDYLFLKATTFYGDRSLKQKVLSEEDWHFFITSLDVVTDLDPYFFDPYILGEGVLTWGTQKYDDANRLLEKGLKYRKNDWRIPYFIGFNYFYFLKNYAKGAEYMMEASRLPGSPAYLPSLAARLAYYGDKTKTALVFLRQMLAESKDQRITAFLQKRLDALEKAVYLEDLIEKFHSEQGRYPAHLTELVRYGYLDKLPVDPYGGQWVFNKSGRVFSTSKFVNERENSSQKP